MDKRDEEYRKELIELKKKRAGNEVPGFERENNAEPSVPMTFSGKIKHFWFYYKFYLAAFLAVAVVAGISIKSCVNRINPDITILCLTKNAILDEDVKLLEDSLRQFAKDYNNNKRVDVTVITVTQNENNTQMNYAMQQKLMAEIAAGQSYIYVSDDVGFERFKTIGALADIGDISENALDKKAVLVTLSDILKDKKTVTLPKSLYFSLRAYDKEVLKKNSDKGKNIKNSIETFKNIINTRPASSNSPKTP